MLELKSVSKEFEDEKKTIFHNLSLYVKPQEFVSIVGPSGCGKTTLLEICAGLQKSYHGLCMLNNQPINQAGLSAYMPQGDSLLAWRRLGRNVALALEQNHSKKEVFKKAKNLLQQFQMHHLMHRWPSELSGGQKQQAALLRAIAYDKELLLLDEPLGSLDSLTRKNIQLWLKKLILKKNKAVLMVTHDIDEAIFLSNRIYVMHPQRALKEIKINIDNNDRNSVDFREKYKEIEESLQ